MIPSLLSCEYSPRLGYQSTPGLGFEGPRPQKVLWICPLGPLSHPLPPKPTFQPTKQPSNQPSTNFSSPHSTARPYVRMRETWGAGERGGYPSFGRPAAPTAHQSGPSLSDTVGLSDWRGGVRAALLAPESQVHSGNLWSCYSGAAGRPGGT